MHDQNPAQTEIALEALRLLRPHDIAGARKIRVGRNHDGGYVMIDRFEGVRAAYSFGINDDVSWDLQIAERGIPIFQYDHTIKGLPEEHPLFHWEPKCIAGTADPDKGVESLESLIRKNGHQDNRNLLLKCDIEGAEWPLMQQTPLEVLAQFRQIVMEVHFLTFLADPHHARNVLWGFQNLTASHRVVHVHANNFSPFAVVGGVPVPYTIELTLLRADEGTLTPSDESFPTALDMPCRAEAADLYLGRFTFD